MDANSKRKIVSEHYPGASWRSKVAKMSDKQVHVIFMRLLNKGELKGRA